MIRTTILAAVATCFVGTTTQAAILAEYNFDNLDGTSSDADLTTVATDAVLSGGGVLDDSRSTGGFSISNGAAVYTGSAVTGSESDAVTDDDFIGFSITGTVLAWQTLTLDMGASHTDSNSPDRGAVYTSTDGINFAKVVGSNFQLAGDDSYLTQVIDLSSLAASNGTQSFRIYLWADSDGGSFESSRYGSVDNIVVNGTPIPEPASLALLGVGGLMILRRRR